MLALEKFIPAKVIDRAVLRGGHEPGAWVVRDARLRPLFEGRDESVLRPLLGKADVAHDARQTGDDPGRLNPPDRIDGSVCMGSRHGYPSHHLQSARASPSAPRLLLHGRPYGRSLLYLGSELLRPEHLANFSLTLPAWPVFFV